MAQRRKEGGERFHDRPKSVYSHTRKTGELCRARVGEGREWRLVMKADDSNPEAWLKKHEKELRKFEDKHPRVDGKKVKLLHNPEEAYARTQKKLVSGWESQIISTETPEEFANWDECSDARDIRREVLLTERQRKVLDLLREGHSRADIARMLKEIGRASCRERV